MDFKDRHGRNWNPQITVKTVKKVRAALGIDLFKVLTDDSQREALFTDIVAIVDTLWVICGDQHPGITEEDFADGLCGDVCEAAIQSLQGAILDFFPDRRVRETFRAVLQKQEAAKTHVAAEMLQKANNLTHEEILSNGQMLKS